MEPGSTLNLDTLVVRRSDIISAPVGAETAMMDVDKGVYYGLDDIGTRIWELVATPCTVSAICERLLAVYDVDAGTCTREVVAFLEGLVKAGVLDVTGG